MTFSEQLTENFYQWERYCRGLYFYEKQVQLEPPFSPFHHLSLNTQFKDDGIAPSLFKRIANLFYNQKEENPFTLQDVNPFWDESEIPLKSFSISITQSTSVKGTLSEQLILMLSLSQYPVSFEIVGEEDTITYQIVCRDVDLKYIQHQIKGYFTGAVFLDNTDNIYHEKYLDIPTCFVDFSLRQEVMRPLNIPTSLDPDPMTGIISVLESLSCGEQAILQIQFSGVINPWSVDMIKAVTVNGEDPFFSNAPEMVTLTKQKVASPLVAVNIKIMTQSHSDRDALNIANSLSQILQQSTKSPFNSLMVINNDEYDFDMRFKDFFNRKSHKLGMLLNIKELQTMVHLPSSSLVSRKLLRDVRRTKGIKANGKNDEFVLGINQHQGIEQLVRVNANQRLKHTHVIGATGTGKSSFLITQIVQDIDLGSGIAVIDPHGDLIEAILKRIPEDRLQDVIIVDPSDTEFPIGFNILSAHSDIERDILSSDLVAVFRRLSTSWGDQMNSVFANAILAFLESNQGGTLVDLRRFLIEKDFREKFLKTITDPSIIYYWQKEYPLLKSTSVGPILTRLDAFLRPKLIRNMVAQQKSLDFENIIDSSKILLIKLSQGLMGSENSYLLGSFFITKFNQAAMARQSQNKEARQNFFIYIDEFQNFITPSMSSMLSGARKYHIGLVLAHQDMQQLVKQDSELASSIVSNAGIRVCFRLGDIDAKRFEDGFSFFETKDLQNLGTGESICRIDRAEFDFNMVSLDLPDENLEDIDSLKEQSRKKYSTPRNEIEEYLKNSLEVYQAETPKESRYVAEQIIPSPKSDVEETEQRFVNIDSIEQKFNTEETKKQLVQQQAQTEHRYLQNFIKKMAEARGFKAIIEDQIPGSNDLIDVTIERNNVKIACEISVSTSEQWELGNITKCIKAGFPTVVSCSSQPSVLEKIKKIALEHFSESDLSKIYFFKPDELFAYLDSLITIDSSEETRIKGYRVQVEYDPLSVSEMAQKRQSVTKLVKESGRKKK